MTATSGSWATATAGATSTRRTSSPPGRGAGRVVVRDPAARHAARPPGCRRSTPRHAGRCRRGRGGDHDPAETRRELVLEAVAARRARGRRTSRSRRPRTRPRAARPPRPRRACATCSRTGAGRRHTGPSRSRGRERASGRAVAGRSRFDLDDRARSSPVPPGGSCATSAAHVVDQLLCAARPGPHGRYAQLDGSTCRTAPTQGSCSRSSSIRGTVARVESSKLNHLPEA